MGGSTAASALVTGASVGLGERFVRALHDAGAHVVATARRGELLERLASECGSRVEIMAGDITDPDHREAVVEHLRSTGLDILVNNAGICDDGPIEEQTLDDLTLVVDVNLISVLDMCRLSAPLLLVPPRPASSTSHPCTASSPLAAPWPPTTPPRGRWST